MKSPLSAAGPIIALSIISAWVASLGVLLALPIEPMFVAPGVLLMTFLSTGLFITAHDAMHGTVAPGSRRMNDIVGAAAVALYALFSYRKLQTKHGEHHSHPATPGADPDFHDGEHSGFWRWYFHFVFGYIGLWQIVGMAAIYNVLAHLVGVPEPNLIVFWVVPALLSTLQLFTFGTYLPHRGEHSAGDPHRARSSGFPRWLSFLTCYHFGYHHEHHEHPGTPWWRLAASRDQ